MAIPAPASITVGDVVRGEEVTISWSAVPDTLGYIVERSLNGAAFGNIPQYDVYNTIDTSITFTVGEDWNTVQYRVQAFKYEGAYLVYSDWTTSPVINVEQAGAENPPAPASITVGEYVRGQPLQITWSPVTFSESFVYTLQYSHDGGMFMTCYDGAETSFTAGVAQSVNSVQYRVRTEVRKSSGITVSDWTTSEVKTAGAVTPPEPGAVSGRLEQFQNSEGKNIYPRTVMEGVFRRSDGKNLDNLAVTADGGAEIVLNGDFGSAPYTITITETEDDDGDGDSGSGGTGGGVGPQGPAGPGVPTGGTAGQALVKNSGESYDTTWKTLFTYGTTDLTPGSSPLTTGQIHLVYE